MLPIELLLLYTAALLSILLVLWKSSRVAVAWIDTRKLKFVRTLAIKNFEIIHEDRLARFLTLTIRFLRLGLSLLCFYFYVPMTLGLFPGTEHLAPFIFQTLLHPLSVAGKAILDFIPDLLVIIAIAGAVRILLKWVHAFFQEVGAEKLHLSNFHSEWAEPTYQLVRVFILAFALAAILPYIPGSRSPGFQGVSVFIGVLLSFGSSSAVGNVIAGILLTYMRPFRKGDRVKIADTEGDIVEKSLLATRVRTIKNVDITIPNSMILGSHIVNYSANAKDEGVILSTRISIGYKTPWPQVHQLLIDAALSTNHVLSEPKPFVLQTMLNDFYVVYELNTSTKMPNLMANIYSELHQNIQNQFDAAGIDIASPQLLSMSRHSG